MCSIHHPFLFTGINAFDATPPSTDVDVAGTPPHAICTLHEATPLHKIETHRWQCEHENTKTGSTSSRSSSPWCSSYACISTNRNRRICWSKRQSTGCGLRWMSCVMRRAQICLWAVGIQLRWLGWARVWVPSWLGRWIGIWMWTAKMIRGRLWVQRRQWRRRLRQTEEEEDEDIIQMTNTKRKRVCKHFFKFWLSIIILTFVPYVFRKYQVDCHAFYGKCFQGAYSPLQKGWQLPIWVISKQTKHNRP